MSVKPYIDLTTHHERDAETGYDYRGARYYDVDLGRFLAVDPLAGEYGAWGPYNYVLGNPLRWVDPSGRAPEDNDYGLDTRTREVSLCRVTNEELHTIYIQE